MASEYDFIIVGSGPAGGALTYLLAKSSKKPQVLLLEAGPDNSDPNLRVDGQRWTTFTQKDLNWGYKTAPQEELTNRVVDYDRGRGLGGSSAINFGVFTVGAKDDYEEWARLVEDPDSPDPSFFSWKRMQARLKSLETFHSKPPAALANSSKYISPNPEDHGSSGPLHVGYPAEWEEDIAPLMDQYEKEGFPLNPDHNSGNPLGLSALISSSHHGKRSTALDLLTQIRSLPNVTILTHSPVQRVLLDTTNPSLPKAIGVESNGTQYLAAKEVILSAGSLDTPKILMHSGLGPEDQLTKNCIPVVLPIPSIGQNLRDHCFCPLVYLRKPSTTTSTGRAAFYSSQEAMDSALVQWKKDGTGPWAKFACQTAIGFFKLGEELTSSKEFLALPESEQTLLNKPTVPHYEIFTHFPMHWFMPEAFPPGGTIDSFNYSCLLVFLYNAQTRGEVTLQSSDPNFPLVFDPKFLGVEFDRRAAIESLRDALRFAKSEEYTMEIANAIAEPAGTSDEDLLGYWRQTMASSWHMTGTTKMGRRGEEDAVVDSGFKVIGVEGLRVADMSVVPVLLSGHTQVGAYLTGLACAERIIGEYGLE